jgi:hypothetical protein
VKDQSYQGDIISDRLRKQALDSNIMEQAKVYALEYLDSVQDRSVFPSIKAIEELQAFNEALPEMSSDPLDILKLLHEKGSPATVAQTGGRDHQPQRFAD